MKVMFSGEPIFNVEDLGDDEFFEFVDNHPNPELMGGWLKKKIQKGTKKIKAKVQKAVKKAYTKYKKLPKWAKIVTGALAAPAVLGLAPAAIGAVAPVAAAAMPVALTTAATAAPVAIPALQAKLIAKKVAARRKAQLAAQQRNVAPVPAAVAEPVTVAAPVQTPSYNSAPAYSPEPQYDYQEEVTSSNVQEPAEEKKGGIPGWLLGAAALIPFFL